MDRNSFEVIIVGGSYAGLSAAMALGRALRKVLIIDSGKPCNRQTPHSHNFITQDGQTPENIALIAKTQVMLYEMVEFYDGLATTGKKTAQGFEITTGNGDKFTAPKLLFATGLFDEMPAITGFAECWGISVLHCPYCHGYEVKGEKLGVVADGEPGFEFCRLISNWSKRLTLYTNGASTLSDEQRHKLKKHSIAIIEKKILSVTHTDGYISQLVFEDQSTEDITAVFTKAAYRQHCEIPQQLGCELTEQGFIQVDGLQKTSVPGVFAAGDNTTMFRAVSIAAASGTKAGAVINKELVDELF